MKHFQFALLCSVMLIRVKSKKRMDIIRNGATVPPNYNKEEGQNKIWLILLLKLRLTKKHCL